jgi:hypothetical protein
MTIEEGIKKGYLEDKIVYLKPSPRRGKMVNREDHVAYFMYEGASINFVLPSEKTKRTLVNPFKNLEEKKFFEETLDLDLNPYATPSENFWTTFRVRFTKDPKTLKDGIKFDLSDPMDNLRYRVVKENIDLVAPNWEERTNKPGYRFALVDEFYEEKRANSTMEALEKIFTFFGTIKERPGALKEFLEVYYMNTKQLKGVEHSASIEWMQKEMLNIIEQDKPGVLNVIDDDDYVTKAFILQAVKAGALEKNGVNSYHIPGETTKWGLVEMVRYIKQLKETTDDTYLRIEAQIGMNKPKKVK